MSNKARANSKAQNLEDDFDTYTMMIDPKPHNEATSADNSSPYAKRTTMAGVSDEEATRLYSA